jgi:nucleotide-binding universal stress UspA family protein
MSETSANALRVGLSSRLIGESGATLLHAFLAIAKGRMYDDGDKPGSIDEYVGDERRTAMDELTSFLVANDLDRPGWSFRLEEGGPMEVISRAVAEMRPDLLVMGTHGRSGLLKALIGSVTEEALRSLNVDILAVPPVER